MDWLEKMNGAISYIEANLDSDIGFEKIARIAGCSSFHFQRMFSFITDIPLSEYIRRRRMTLAAYELQNSDIKIIDIALKYGYNSPNSFTRAFQNMHGVTPSTARKISVQLKAYPRISFHITIQGDVEMNYKIMEAKESKLFGTSIEVSFINGKGYEDIDEFVKNSWQNGLRERIRAAAGYGTENIYSDKLLGIALYGFKEDGSYRFMLTAEYPPKGVTKEFEVLDIPEATWVVFSTSCEENEELDTVTKIWKRLPEWFQATGYELKAGIPELEKCYRTGNGYMAEVWVPICR
jgi:AraC family transcriptional regulator